MVSFVVVITGGTTFPSGFNRRYAVAEALTGHLLYFSGSALCFQGEDGSPETMFRGSQLGLNKGIMGWGSTNHGKMPYCAKLEKPDGAIRDGLTPLVLRLFR